MSKMQLNELEEIKISIVGLGGLGCPALFTLCRNWQNCTTKKLQLKIIDHDEISLSNLNRQILFSANTISNKKIDAALSAINKNRELDTSNIEFIKIYEKLDSKSINEHLNDSNVIIDCTDDPELKITLNRFSILKKKILIYGGVHGFEGLVFSILPGGPCINCVFGNFNSEDLCELGGSCSSGGVIGGIAGIIGQLQIEKLFSLLEEPNKPASHYLKYVNKFGQIREIEVKPDSNCVNGCGLQPRTTVDLTSFKCPETFLYAKLSLEKLKKDLNQNYLELVFASESDLLNVNESIKKEGYQFTSEFISEDFSEYRLVVSLRDS